MHIGTLIYTKLFGEHVGDDAFGNRYYRRKRALGGQRREQRWIVYKGLAEPSKVPAAWHGWLHYTHDAVPDEHAGKQYGWQQPHQPNLTGTPGRYVPPGHPSTPETRARVSGDYEPWIPE